MGYFEGTDFRGVGTEEAGDFSLPNGPVHCGGIRIALVSEDGGGVHADDERGFELSGLFQDGVDQLRDFRFIFGEDVASGEAAAGNIIFLGEVDHFDGGLLSSFVVSSLPEALNADIESGNPG